MDQDALVTEAIDAGAEFIAEFDKFMPVEVALWLKPDASSQWYLYIASPRIRDVTLDQGYREVLRLAGRMRNSDLDPLQIKLIPSDAPLARAAVEMQRRYPGPRPTRLGRKYLGGVVAEEAYIYPPTIASSVP